MDRTQLSAFLDYAIGERVIDSADGEDIITPHSPEIRGFIVARLGDKMPIRAWEIVPTNSPLPLAAKEKAQAFAQLLRKIADGIDPPTAQ